MKRLLKYSTSFLLDRMKVAKLFDEYPEKSACVNDLLHMAQETSYTGWLTQEMMNEVAELCEVSPVQVYENAYFYSMFNTEPVGVFVLNVCVTTPCMLCGSDEIVETIRRTLNIDVGQTTLDGRFTLKEFECLGCCVDAPAMAVADFSDPAMFKYNYYEDLTPDGVVKIINELRDGKTPAPGKAKARKKTTLKGTASAN